MIRQGVELFAAKAWWRGPGVSFVLVQYDEQGNRQIPARIEWVAMPANGEQVMPTFTLIDERAQQLIDALWDAGLRPSQGAQSEGVTNAQAAHLADMRAIAFAKLEINRPDAA